MVSLNDVLLAMSNIPVDDPIAEIWGRQMQGGYKIIEYTGALPITITANGNALLDYRIYGASGGVGEPTGSGEPAGYKLPMVTSDGTTETATPVYIGDTPLGEDEYVDYSEQAIYKRTENLCPPLSSSKWSPGYITVTGTITSPSAIRQEKVSDWIKVDGGNRYCFYDISGFPAGGENAWVAIGAWDENRNWLDRYSWGGTAISYKTCDLPNDAAYVRLTMRTYGEDDDNLSFTKSSIPPDPYIPYLKLTDPPVPLPEIPTIKGETVIDYDGDPKPSQMYVKYKGKG